MGKEFDAITEDEWKSTVNARIKTLKAGESSSWQKQMLTYLPEVASNGKPYLDPNSTHPSGYITDNEGQKVWPGIGDAIGTVNVMSYDMDQGMKLNFGKILYNYHTFGKFQK